jgi:hypothetical protein
VTQLDPTLPSERLELDVDLGVPLDAVYRAACAFTDRCYARLDHVPPSGEGAAQQVRIVLRGKARSPFEASQALREATLASLAAELREELARQTLMVNLEAAGRDLTTDVIIGAFGATPEGPPLDASAFDDPLGIATSWEETGAAPTGGGQAT